MRDSAAGRRGRAYGEAQFERAFTANGCKLRVFFFSSRRRHTRYPLVTGVQTCALPIYFAVPLTVNYNEVWSFKTFKKEFDTTTNTVVTRSEERRVGKECRSRWSPY